MVVLIPLDAFLDLADRLEAASGVPGRRRGAFEGTG